MKLHRSRKTSASRIGLDKTNRCQFSKRSVLAELDRLEWSVILLLRRMGKLGDALALAGVHGGAIREEIRRVKTHVAATQLGRKNSQRPVRLQCDR